MLGAGTAVHTCFPAGTTTQTATKQATQEMPELELPPACFGRVVLNYDRLNSDLETAAAYALWLMFCTCVEDRVYSPSSSALYRGLLRVTHMSLMTSAEYAASYQGFSDADDIADKASERRTATTEDEYDRRSLVLVAHVAGEPRLQMVYSKARRAVFISALCGDLRDDGGDAAYVAEGEEVYAMFAWLGRKALVMIGMSAFHCTPDAARIMQRYGSDAGVNESVVQALQKESIPMDCDVAALQAADSNAYDVSRMSKCVLYEPVTTDAYLCAQVHN